MRILLYYFLKKIKYNFIFGRRKCILGGQNKAFKDAAAEKRYI
jgi:hypothetical protein